MEKISFNNGWLYGKSGREKKQVFLPHDAMQEEMRSPQAASGSAGAFYPGGIYEYEKTFHVPEDWVQKHIVFQFEGVYKNSRILLNGREAGGAAYGYIPFFVCADEFLHYGEENTIRVIADNQNQPNSRWYSGSGVYRPVWLWIGDQEYIAPEGVKIKTISCDPARIQVKTTHTGGTGTDIRVEIVDQNNFTIANGRGEALELEIPDALLWSDEAPNLYECRVTLEKNGEILDAVTESFGIRKVEWSAKGLFVNGRETLLRGGCLHHDQGILGAATYRESEFRRINRLKAAGFNAVRSSHNPASSALLEACDYYGMYVIDETWDMWYQHKNAFDYASDFPFNYRFDIESMVNRDYNHPSVIMYSIGNEVSEPASDKGLCLAKEMAAYLHQLDSSRAVTAGINLMILYNSSKGQAVYKADGGREDKKKDNAANMDSSMFNQMAAKVGRGLNNSANSPQADEVTSPVLDALDIAGYNYASGRYPLEETAHPDRVIVGSETFPQDIVRNWSMVKQYPYLIGDFMWTCWDYLGEAGIGAWAYTPDGMGFEKPYPWLLADTGAFDILGNPNGELFQAQAAWGLLKNPAIAVQPVNHPGEEPAKAVWRGTNAIPSWSWQGCEGNMAIVEVYTGDAFVELYLDHCLIGEKEVQECKAAFEMKYHPGTMTAVSYNAQHQETGRSELVSASGALSIQLTPETDRIMPDQIAYVRIAIAGENGQIESNADELLHIYVDGGELLAFGSANPRTEESYQNGSFTTYYGQALAIVKAAVPGVIRIQATSGSGLTGAAEISVCTSEKEGGIL